MRKGVAYLEPVFNTQAAPEPAIFRYTSSIFLARNKSLQEKNYHAAICKEIQSAEEALRLVRNFSSRQEDDESTFVNINHRLPVDGLWLGEGGASIIWGGVSK